MKKILMSLFLALALITAPIGFNGCALFQQSALPSISEQNADQIILTAEKAAETAKVTFNAFVHLERDNEATLKAVSPQIHIYANTIRDHGIDWIESLRNVTKTFKINRTPDNRATLNTILATLLSAIGDTNKFITESNTAIGH